MKSECRCTGRENCEKVQSRNNAEDKGREKGRKKGREGEREGDRETRDRDRDRARVTDMQGYKRRKGNGQQRRPVIIGR